MICKRRTVKLLAKPSHQQSNPTYSIRCCYLLKICCLARIEIASRAGSGVLELQRRREMAGASNTVFTLFLHSFAHVFPCQTQVVLNIWEAVVSSTWKRIEDLAVHWECFFNDAHILEYLQRSKTWWLRYIYKRQKLWLRYIAVKGLICARTMAALFLSTSECLGLFFWFANSLLTDVA